MKEAEQQLEDEIRADSGADGRAEPIEDDEHGDDEGGGGLPLSCKVASSGSPSCAAVRKQLEAERGDGLQPKSQKSFGGPDANMMLTGEGSLQYCYNAQAATGEDGVACRRGDHDVTARCRSAGADGGGGEGEHGRRPGWSSPTMAI